MLLIMNLYFSDSKYYMLTANINVHCFLIVVSTEVSSDRYLEFFVVGSSKQVLHVTANIEVPHFLTVVATEESLDVRKDYLVVGTSIVEKKQLFFHSIAVAQDI